MMMLMYQEVYTEAVASLVEQVLDPGHMGGVTVLGVKTVLAVLTSARLRDRLAFLFREHSDHQVRLLLCHHTECLKTEKEWSIFFGDAPLLSVRVSTDQCVKENVHQ